MTNPGVRVKASVPEVVIGEPATDNPVGTVAATEVTVPAPPVNPSVEVATQKNPNGEVEDACRRQP